MSEDAQQPDGEEAQQPEGATEDGATEQTPEVQAAAPDDKPADDEVPENVKAYVEARIVRLVANGQIQPAPPV